jgi:hypothetical protein
MPDGIQRISTVLRELCADAEGRTTIGEIVERFGRRAFGALLFVFSTPNLLPLPPGSSTVLGAPLVLLAPQVAMGVRSPWLPPFVHRHVVSGADLSRAFGRLLPWVERIERVSRPRLAFLFGPVGDRVIGVVCTLLALVLVLPIPFGNLLPAAAVAVLAFALVQRDGVLALVGHLLALASLGVLVLTAGALAAAVKHLLGWLGAA